MLSQAFEDVERELFPEMCVSHPCNDDDDEEDDTHRVDYYKVGGIEVIDYIKAKLTKEQYKGYLLGNIYKYSGRCQYKGEYEKDVIKLGQYVNWLLKCSR
jgi:hypothetical protein